MKQRFTKEWLEGHQVFLGEIERSSIIGIGHVMAELDSLLARLHDPEAARSLALELPRGILLHGQPGLGKTLVARYLATRLGATIPFFEVSSDELTPDRLRGAVHWLSAHYDRSVLYLDEVDQWAMARDSDTHSPATRLLLTAALAALDGIVPSSGVILIASSNRAPFHLDPALMRAGRIGFHVRFDHPDEAERAELLRHFIGSRPTAGPIDIERAAKLTRGRSPADIRAMTDDGYGLSLAAGRRALTDEDLVDAIRRAGEVVPEDDEDNPGLRHRLAIHEAGHTAVACALRGSSWVYSVAIRSADGHTKIGSEKVPLALTPDDEQRDAIVVYMAGMAAERLLLDGGPSQGAIDDIGRATNIALSRLDAGLDDAVPPVSLDQFGARASESLRDAQGQAVSRLLEEARRRAARIVSRNLAGIEALAALLEASSELVGDALVEALSGRFLDEDGASVP